jgi:hypothetical protein
VQVTVGEIVDGIEITTPQIGAGEVAVAERTASQPSSIESAKVLEIAIDEAGAAKRGIPQAATQARAMAHSAQTRCIPKIAIHEVGRAQVAAGKSATIQARDSAAS